MKISPKRSPKSILEEGQTSRKCHVKQAVPDSKGRACHATKPGEADRKVARATRATRHGRATWGRGGTAVPPLPWCSPTLKYGVFVLLRGSFSFS